MTGIFLAGILLGALGSVHCIGMCGPLALALPVVNQSHQSRFISTLLYNAGRIVTYSILGAVFGLIGMSFALFGLQQWLSIILGIAILVIVLFPKKKLLSPRTRPFEKIRSILGRFFQQRSYNAIFLIG